MRIGFEAKRATHNFRGLGNYARGVIEGIAEYYPKEELFLYTAHCKDLRTQKWIESLSSNTILKYPQTFIESQLSTLWRSFLLTSYLKKDRLDIFHGLSHEIPYGLREAMPFKKIVTIHDLIFLRYPDFFPFIDRLVYKQKFQYACKNADIVIAICEQTKKDLIDFLQVDEKKIIVHYQSCSPLFYSSLNQTVIARTRDKYNLKQPFILHVGAFEERKNQFNILCAFEQIAEKIGVDLVFVGEGKRYKDQVRHQTEKFKLNHRVHFLNSILLDELPGLYQAASVFCFPSLFEGFGIPIIEALFSKTPVITSFGSCFPESAGADSFFVDPMSIASIADGLLKVLSDQILQEKMRTSGLDFVQQFHQEKTTANLIGIYQKALS